MRYQGSMRIERLDETFLIPDEFNILENTLHVIS